MTINSGTDGRSQRQRWQLLITAAALLAFGAVAFYMLAVATDANAEVWQRRVYVFSGVQAVAFTAVGWLFGREVNSGARAEAQQAKTEARRANVALADARSKESAVRAAVKALADQEADAQVSERGFAEAAGPVKLRQIQEMVDDIYDR